MKPNQFDSVNLNELNLIGQVLNRAPFYRHILRPVPVFKGTCYSAEYREYFMESAGVRYLRTSC